MTLRKFRAVWDKNPVRRRSIEGPLRVSDLMDLCRTVADMGTKPDHIEIFDADKESEEKKHGST